jgi:transposase InsO family protein
VIFKKLNLDIKILCDITKVSRSGYYKWLKDSGKPDKDTPDYELIKEVFGRGKGKLGWRSIQMKLFNGENKIVMNHKKIIRIMKKYYLFVKIRIRNPYKCIAKKTQEHRTFANILNREFEQLEPLKVFCTDITYLYYGYGQKAYLSAVKDVASGEIVSWKMSQGLGLGIVLETIDRIKIPNLENTIIHSDQGFHYTSPEYSKKIKNLGITQSMSRKGNCIDNSPMESFFGHLKDDIDCKEAKTFNDLDGMINNYMEYYNNDRYQWDLKKMTPVQYRDHLLCQV